jgi:hypothetical protein
MKNDSEEVVKALTIVAALLLVFCVFAPHAHADEWTTDDKFQHYEAGRVASMLATTQVSKPKAVVFGAAVGVAKELVDAGGYGDPSTKDAVVTLAGALAGAYAPGLAIRKRGAVTSVSYTWSF